MPCWIYIGGYPGVGKLTIAKALKTLIPGSRIFSNHELIDCIDVPRDHPHYHDKRTDERRNALSNIVFDESQNGLIWIFTDSRSNTPIGSTGAEDYKTAAVLGGIPFISVILNCTASENIRRLRERDVEGTTKLTDAETLIQLRDEEAIYQFYGERELSLDVTDLSPCQAAKAILSHVHRFPDTGLAPETEPDIESTNRRVPVSFWRRFSKAMIPAYRNVKRWLSAADVRRVMREQIRGGDTPPLEAGTLPLVDLPPIRTLRRTYSPRTVDGSVWWR